MRRLYGLAAAHEDADAQYNLGALPEDGLGGPQDYAEARPLFGLEEAQGDAGAQYNLIALHAAG